MYEPKERSVKVIESAHLIINKNKDESLNETFSKEKSLNPSAKSKHIQDTQGSLKETKEIVAQMKKSLPQGDQESFQPRLRNKDKEQC